MAKRREYRCELCGYRAYAVDRMGYAEVRDSHRADPDHRLALAFINANQAFRKVNAVAKQTADAFTGWKLAYEVPPNIFEVMRHYK